jgi:hypothetical protein
MLVDLPPATLLSTETHVIYRHYGLVTVRGTVISCSAKHGGTTEEFVHHFAEGKAWKVETPLSDSPWWDVLNRAYAFAGKPYHVTDWNCETYVNACFGLPPRSRQVEATAVVAGLGLIALVARSVSRHRG